MLAEFKHYALTLCSVRARVNFECVQEMRFDVRLLQRVPAEGDKICIEMDNTPRCMI